MYRLELNARPAALLVGWLHDPVEGMERVGVLAQRRGGEWYTWESYRNPSDWVVNMKEAVRLFHQALNSGYDGSVEGLCFRVSSDLAGMDVPVVLSVVQAGDDNAYIIASKQPVPEAGLNVVITGSDKCGGVSVPFSLYRSGSGRTYVTAGSESWESRATRLCKDERVSALSVGRVRYGAVTMFTEQDGIPGWKQQVLDLAPIMGEVWDGGLGGRSVDQIVEEANRRISERGIPQEFRVVRERRTSGKYILLSDKRSLDELSEHGFEVLEVREYGGKQAVMPPRTDVLKVPSEQYLARYAGCRYDGEIVIACGVILDGDIVPPEGVEGIPAVEQSLLNHVTTLEHYYKGAGSDPEDVDVVLEEANNALASEGVDLEFRAVVEASDRETIITLSTPRVARMLWSGTPIQFEDMGERMRVAQAMHPHVVGHVTQTAYLGLWKVRHEPKPWFISSDAKDAWEAFIGAVQPAWKEEGVALDEMLNLINSELTGWKVAVAAGEGENKPIIMYRKPDASAEPGGSSGGSVSLGSSGGVSRGDRLVFSRVEADGSVTEMRGTVVEVAADGVARLDTGFLVERSGQVVNPNPVRYSLASPMSERELAGERVARIVSAVESQVQFLGASDSGRTSDAIRALLDKYDEQVGLL